jgi:hypothetical protein
MIAKFRVIVLIINFSRVQSRFFSVRAAFVPLKNLYFTTIYINFMLSFLTQKLLLLISIQGRFAQNLYISIITEHKFSYNTSH